MKNQSKTILAGRTRRGEVTPDHCSLFSNLSDQALITQLADADPQKRTAAARLLGKRKCIPAIHWLCEALAVETALYSRLSQCEALAAIGSPAVDSLVDLLGKIGSNQHTTLPTRGFYKKSYPLPRDIAARTLSTIGRPALPALQKNMLEGERASRLEAVDALGHICFYAQDIRCEPQLLAAYARYAPDSLMRWKIIRAMQAFHGREVEEILISVILDDPLPELRWEAVRSLGLITSIPPTSVCTRARLDLHPEVREMARLFLY